MTHAAAAAATPRVPDGIDDDSDVMSAALAYAKAGWYVLPIEAAAKKPAAELGKDWGTKSSRDPEQIVAWFAGTGYGVGLHVGRSGVAAFDVDHPEQLPEPLARAIAECAPPAHATRDAPQGGGRADGPRRAHYLFAFRGGRVLGNGTGRLGGAWGEIRGRGGQIVVAPTEHADGGHYHWIRTGPVPELPAYVDELLSEAAPGADAATDAEVVAFLDAHSTPGVDHRPELLDAWVATFTNKVADGESRHQRMISIAAGALSEARAGYYSARTAMDRLEEAFITAVTGEPVPGSQQKPARSPAMARSEWMGISAWAVAQAQAADLGEVRARVAREMPDPLAWIPGDTPPPGPDGSGGGVSPGPGPDRFFDKHEGLLVATLAAAVEQAAPIATDTTGAVWTYRDGVWRPDGDRAIREHVATLLGQRYRMSHAANAASFITSRRPAIDLEDADTSYLNVANGMLDWRTGELLPHDPKHHSTIRIPVAWNPEASCPAIGQWMTEVFPPELLGFVGEIIGYALYNDNPLHKAVMLHGSGRNGKGTFLRLIKALVGEANISNATPQSLDENRFRAAELYGKLANLAGDVDPHTFTATETFKQITGGDRVLAERKYGQPFSFTCRALMIAAFNALPRSADTSEGFFSRWLVVPFTGYYPPGVAKPERELKMHSKSELEGLLVLAVASLKRLMERGRFDEPAAVTQATAGFRQGADPVRAFLGEYAPGLATEWAPRTEVYRRYTDWAAENGYRSMSAATFYERVAAAEHDIEGYVVTSTKRMGTRGFNFVRRIGVAQ